jgi:drug/metabolite transporter (DMT)-like permease
LFIVFVPFIGWMMFRRRPLPLQIVSVGVALAGLSLLTGGLTELNAGDALTLFAAVSYALHVLLTDRYVGRGNDAYILCFTQMFVTGLLGLATAVSMGVSVVLPEGPVIQQLLFLTIFPTLTAFLLQIWAQRYITPLKVALIFMLEPVFGAGFAWTLGNEEFIWLRAAGGLVILVSMLLSELAPKHSPVTPVA